VRRVLIYRQEHKRAVHYFRDYYDKVISGYVEEIQPRLVYAL